MAPALPDPQTFEQVVALIGEKREVGLQMDVERYVKPVSFKPGAIVYESVQGAPIELARKLSARLREWTGRTWLIAANGQGGPQQGGPGGRGNQLQAILNNPQAIALQATAEKASLSVQYAGFFRTSGLTVDARSRAEREIGRAHV